MTVQCTTSDSEKLLHSTLAVLTVYIFNLLPPNSCLQSPISQILSSQSLVLSLASCLTSQCFCLFASCLLLPSLVPSLVSCLTSQYFCLLLLVFHLLHTSCLPSPIYCLLSPISCLLPLFTLLTSPNLSLVSCLSSPNPCLDTATNNISDKRHNWRQTS